MEGHLMAYGTDDGDIDNLSDVDPIEAEREDDLRDMDNQRNAHRLYHVALRADNRLTATIAARTDGKRDRWTMTAADHQIPEIREALRAKHVALDAYLSFTRWLRGE